MTTLQQKQPNVHRLFSKLVKENKLGHAYIFEGVSGSGKKAMAKYISKALFCRNKTEASATPCLTCGVCRNIEIDQHIDTIIVEKSGASIKVDQIRQLKGELTTSGLESSRKVIIIDEADKMTISAANSLLKFLEEPQGDVMLFLLTASKQNVLPTIISRCQVIAFRTQPIQQRLEALRQLGLTSHQAALSSQLTEDNQRAVQLIQETNLQEIAKSIWRWLNLIGQYDDQAFIHVTKSLLPLAKENETKTLILDVLLLLLRDLLKGGLGLDHIPAFSAYSQQLEALAERWSTMRVNRGIDFTLQAQKMLDSHVNLQGVLEYLTLNLLENQKGIRD